MRLRLPLDQAWAKLVAFPPTRDAYGSLIVLEEADDDTHGGIAYLAARRRR